MKVIQKNCVSGIVSALPRFSLGPFLIPLCLFILFSCINQTNVYFDESARAKQLRDELNAIAPNSVEVDSGNSTYVNVINSLTLTANISVPAGVTLVVKGDRTLTVGKGTTLDLTGGGLALENNSTFTVNGTVNAKATVSLTSFGIGIMPGPAGNVTINGSGIIHLKTQGILLAVTAGQNLTLAGSVTLDGLSTGTTYPGTDTPYPAGIGGDATDNIFHVVFVGGTLNMLGGTITGNYNIDSTQVGGGGVEVNKYDGGYGAALFTMSGGVITGNGSNYDGGGVNVCKGGTFIMQGNAEVSGNGAFFSSDGGGVSVHNGGYFTMKGGVIKNNTGYRGGGVCVRDNEIDISTFIMEGGTIYGSDSDYANTASSGYGYALYVGDDVTAKWGTGVTTHQINDEPSGEPGGDITSEDFPAVNYTIYAVTKE